MAAERPFFLLLRSRRAWFRRQSFALYLRYAHALGVALMFCGLLLVERPALLAEPILHFWRAPGGLAPNAGWAATWLACVYVWVRIHRDFVSGGAMAAFSRSLPGAVAVLPLVDAAMLLVCLQVFLLPAGLAAWTVAREGGPGMLFAARAALLAMLTLAAARWALGGMPRRGWPVWAALAGYLVLCGAGMLGAAEPWAMPAAALAVGAGVLRVLASGVPAPAGGAASVAPPAPDGPGAGFLLRLQWIVLARRHPHAALPRLALAVAILLACLWMIFGVGKHAESDAFVQVACWLVIAVMSGFFYLFWSTRQPLTSFLHTLPHGVLRMALAEHLLVAGATALLFGAAWAACLPQSAHGAQVAGQWLRHGAAALCVLPLLGLPVVQRREDGMLLKIPILVASFLLLG